MADLVIVGAGGHGREVLDIVEALAATGHDLACAGFVDDAPSHPERLGRRNVALLGPVALLEQSPAPYVLGIGDAQVRADLDDRLTRAGCAAVGLAHPASSVGSDNRLAPGVVLAAGARVTTNVTLGRHVHLNVNAVVSHDCVVGDHTTLSPGVHLNGEVSVGARVFVGTGAIVLPRVTIGDDAIVGAGAVVVADVAAGAVVKGVPAR